MDGIVGAVDGVLGVCTSIFTWILANPLMLFFVGASLIPIGFKIFKGGKKAAKG